MAGPVPRRTSSNPGQLRLLVEECTSNAIDAGADDYSHEDYVIARMEQTHQLWYMDRMGCVRSAFDCRRCMAVPSSHVSGGGGSGGGGGGGDVVAEEAPVEIGPRAGWEGGGTTRISVDSYMAKKVG